MRALLNQGTPVKDQNPFPGKGFGKSSAKKSAGQGT